MVLLREGSPGRDEWREEKRKLGQECGGYVCGGAGGVEG